MKRMEVRDNCQMIGITVERMKIKVELGGSEDAKDPSYVVGTDEEFVTSRLPEFKIVLTDDSPIYQRPRHF